MMRSFAIRGKKILYLLLFTLCFAGIQDFCHKKTQGFTLDKARSSENSSHRPSISLEEHPSLPSILGQPFYFFKKGLQCYVFISEDQKYVLKLFRWKELEPSLISKLLPSFWTRDNLLQKKKKKEHDFTSYQIAQDELIEETGLTFLHLEKTTGLNIPLYLYDPLLIRHIIPADDIEFLLQKKVDTFLPYFEKNKNHLETLYPFFSKLAELLQSRVEKRISDSDISLQYNMGICEGAPILFDIGNLTKTEEIRTYRESLEYEARLIVGWLAENSPELKVFFENCLYKEKHSCEDL